MKTTPIVKMPKVGDRIMRVMVTHQSWKDDTPLPCVVTYVNKQKNYYQVTFQESGVKECYKIPDLDELGSFVKDYKKLTKKKPKGVYVYESGMLYSSITECAKAIGVLPCTVSKHLHGGSSNVKGYHIYIL